LEIWIHFLPLLTIWLKMSKTAKTPKSQLTEEKILDAARKIFVQQGMMGARMQDIADEAGINKALLHYYFKNKEQLFEMIFKQASIRLFPRINQIFNSDDPLFVKIESFCAEYIDVVMENPYLPLFVLNEIHRDTELFIQKIWGESNRPNPLKLLMQIEEEVQKGTIRRVNPMHLLMNMISMTMFPFVARPMLQANLGMDDWTFRMMMEQRKKEIPDFIIRSIKL